MKIVVAMDSFKESLTAIEACEVVAQVLRGMRGETEVTVKPMADGGEGTAAAMIAAGGGEWIAKEVTGPLMDMRVQAGFGWFAAEKCAVVEMAMASGLELLAGDQRDPLRTTTYGTGELVTAAIEHGAKKVMLTVGGSATVDCGIGAAMAMGWRFVDEHGRDFCIGESKLSEIVKILRPEKSINVEVEVLCDVDNPLCGERGAARVYGPQKGATAEMVEELEKGLSHVAKLVREQLGIDIADLEGAGAAGGLAGGAVAFTGGKLVSGIETVMAHCGLKEELEQADWVITGEGEFDEQSLGGKVVSGILRSAKESQTKIAVIAGKVDVDEERWRQCGIDAVLACQAEGMDEYEAMAQAERLLGAAAVRFAMNDLRQDFV